MEQRRGLGLSWGGGPMKELANKRASAEKDKRKPQEAGQYQQRTQEEEGGKESRLLHPRREGVGHGEYFE